MIAYTGNSMVSSLGMNTYDNMKAILSSESKLRSSDNYAGLQESFFGSFVSEDVVNAEFKRLSGKDSSKFTKFEKMAYIAIAGASANMSLSDDNTLFVLSSTKGNVELFNNCGNFDKQRAYLWSSASVIAHLFNNKNTPVVVSNACISGLVAQIVAKRWLDSGLYKRVVVVGADVLSAFVVAGFQSFKALSTKLCRPFDESRDGLNIGEGAACLIMENVNEADGHLILEAESITNDANHISGPSRTGEGLYLAMEKAMQGAKKEDLAFISLHGTATLYNDEMESIAVERCALSDVPVFSLKPYLGHTLGACGVLETVVAWECLKHRKIPESMGFSKCGTTRPLNVNTSCCDIEKRVCLKTASGFGGCNAALRLKLY